MGMSFGKDAAGENGMVRFLSNYGRKPTATISEAVLKSERLVGLVSASSSTLPISGVMGVFTTCSYASGKFPVL